MSPSAMAVPPPPPPREPVARVSDVISTYRPTKIFRPEKSDTSTTSLDFDDQGELLLTAGDDESLQIYSCKEGKHVKTLFSKKYGAHLARFTHHSSSVLYSSTKGDPVIRYLSTHDNQYIRYFSGHSSTVTSLALSPASDTFASCSVDNTVKLWSLSTPNPSGTLNLTTPHLASFDPSASVLAIASPATNVILLYDLRNYDKAPFATFDLLPHENTYLPLSASSPTRAGWTKLEFSNDGAYLLLATSGGGHFLLDAFSGELKSFCVRKTPPQQIARLTPGAARAGVLGQGDVCFSPDGRYLLGASGAENLFVWDTQQKSGDPDHHVLTPIHELPSKAPASLVAFNPRFNMCVTADKEVVMWVPDKNAGSD